MAQLDPTAADLPTHLEAALTERFTELGNPFSAMRRHEEGPDGWPASHPVGPHHVAEVLRELMAANAEATPAGRTLTDTEYSAAWHAIEGAAGEEGADPATVLHAVLDRLGIAYPGAGEQPAADASERCGKCKQPFDPTDTRHDGRAQSGLTPYCRGCVDRCMDTESADHRCVICG